ncbi:hypothetical protein F8B43_0011 [Methylorubrum populi]|uniref:Uncharacterized protein n=1 Tax=Methylorubrum populi TaxID=223967 RepID=A0A833N1X3_9HYPH|nr:hypothetical protein F8B43_0011 [Methylorubrum populi]
MSGLPGEAHRGREARDESDRTAGTEKVAKAPEKAGRPWQGSPQVKGGNGLSSPSLGGTQNTSRRENDADGPGRQTAKDGAAAIGRRAWRRLVRLHGWLEQRG